MSLEVGRWTQVLSVGPKTDAEDNVLSETGMIAEGCEGSSHCIRLSWTDFVVDDESAESYQIFRWKKGESFNSSSPLATTNFSYFVDADSEILNGTTYYYKVGVRMDGKTYFGDPEMPEIEVIKPSPNKAFVHRWMANLEICDILGRGFEVNKGVDIKNNYRCEYNGFGSTMIDGIGYYDLGRHLIVDRFEMGCNFSHSVCSPHDPGDGSSTTDCVGDSDPGGSISAPLNSVFFSRLSSQCWLNSDGGTTWVQFSSLSNNTDRRQVSKSAANLPPLYRVDTQHVADFCSAQSTVVDGQSKAMRIPRKSEFMIYAAWEEISPATALLESGQNESGYCNTDSGHGLTFDSTYPPVVPATLAGNSSRQLFTSGSDETNQCVSKFGVQDAIGNVYEWTSDEINMTVGSTSSTDPENDEYNGILFDNILAAGQTNSAELTDFPYYSVVLGIPLVCDSGCNNDDKLVPTSKISSSGDMVWIHTSHAIPRGSLVGGLWADGDSAGRFRVGLDQGITTLFPAGVRCVAPIE